MDLKRPQTLVIEAPRALPLPDNSDKNGIAVLLIEDDPRTVTQVRDCLARVRGTTFEVAWSNQLDSGLENLHEMPIDVVVLGLALPDYAGLEALTTLQTLMPGIPVVVLAGVAQERLAMKALQRGAIDYLLRGHLDSNVLGRCLRYAVKRKRSEQALQESEGFYHSLVESLPQNIFRKDLQGRFTFANRGFCAGLGKPLQAILGKTDFDFYPPELAEKYRQDDERVLETGTNLETVEEHRTPAGETIYVQVVKTPLYDGQGSAIGTQGIVWDITERKRSEEALRASQEEFRVARHIQQGLYPRSAPLLPGCEVAGASFPANATGGDYFDYFPMHDGSIGLVLGDASGHGVGPALLSASTRAYLRALALTHTDVGALLSSANNVLSGDISDGHFVTVLLAHFDPHRRLLTHASAGHQTGYVLDCTGAVKASLTSTGYPLGVNARASVPAGPVLSLAAGDLVLLLTDGIPEAHSDADVSFGIGRALEIVRQHRAEPARQIIAALHAAVRLHCKPRLPHDDVTALVLKVEG